MLYLSFFLMITRKKSYLRVKNINFQKKNLKTAGNFLNVFITESTKVFTEGDNFVGGNSSTLENSKHVPSRL